MMMPILYKYLWYYESSCCVCGLVLNTYTIMGNYTVDHAKWNIWGGVIFENLLFHLGVGDIKNSSLICSITCLFHRFEIKRGQFSEVLMSIFSDEKLTTPVIMKAWHLNSCFTIPTISELEKKKNHQALPHGEEIASYQHRCSYDIFTFLL